MSNLVAAAPSSSPFIFNVQPHSLPQPLKLYNATRKKHRSRNFNLKMCSSSSISQNATVVRFPLSFRVSFVFKHTYILTPAYAGRLWIAVR
ncbi:hypothetical protein TSUD_29990 [Trifolium subterraneum]|uniref:Uncharacterized protein n=1 Tax=Trifolium subterraneum TaxID=3900 RepID=A0A2Z6NDQ3_TRISU|nr:hypothetical protein TSUD_29990 [Trifolium subterraneum]